MKASKLLVTITLGLTAYGCDSSSPADGRGASTPKMEAMAASAVGMTTASRAVVGREAAPFSGAPSAAADAVSPEGPPSRQDPLQGVNAGSAAPTMVIRTGQAFIEVEKVDAAVLKIRRLATQVGGYITNSSISGGRDQVRQATFELKIPAPKYDPAVDLLS